MTTQMTRLMRMITLTLVASAVMATPVLAVEAALMIPAAAFSADGTDQFNYINYGNYIDTETTLHFHAGVKLPNAARITNVDMMTRDSDVGTITVHLRRLRFGTNGPSEALLTFTSPGNIGCTTNGLCHDMESLLDIKVDSANFVYWLEAIIPDDTGTGTDLNFYAVRIMYEYDDLIFADTFESTATDMWSSESTLLKAGTCLGDEPGDQPDPALVADGGRSKAEILDDIASRLYIEDPLAQEAMEAALKGEKSYGSPLVIPGPAFKTEGYGEYDDYYFSESYGFVYTRPQDNDGAVMMAPVNLPDGAEIQYYFAFFVDSITDHGLYGYQDNIRFWLTRLHTIDIVPTLNMVYTTSSGADPGIRTVSVNRSAMEAVEAGCTTIDNFQYTYWVTIDVGRYDLNPPAPYDDEEWWHKVYSIMILYTMP
jgi:hypothetical protein